MKRRTKDRSHWGDAAFKVMHEKAMSKPSARELIAHSHDPHGRLLNCDELAARVEKVLALLESKRVRDSGVVTWVEVQRILNGEEL